MPAITKPNLHFDATLYNGNSSTQNITGVGFKPDLVWSKARNSNGTPHALFDSVRGVSKLLQSHDTALEQNDGADLTSFNSDGFGLTHSPLTNITNYTGRTYVAWQWKAGGAAVTNTSGTISSQVSANPTAGFSIVSYTGPGSGGGTVGHGLGVAPSMIIVKNRSAVESWRVGHSFMNGGSSPWSYYMNLNGTGAQVSEASIWNNTAPTSSVFTIANDTAVSGSGNSLVAYCFAPIAGYSAFGYYTGNGSTDGTFVYLGFRPKWMLIKRTTTEAWILVDSSRDPYNLVANYILANTTAAEANGVSYDFVSNGIKFRGNSQNESAATYIYAAFAEAPFKFSNGR